ncbi:MAG: CinA family protein [Helicobacteraceae bacterium]|jgi:nicotinamide-nucleotide amidase|nr:CinA family protein [Helicobacteraceae bacterium]
MLEQNRLVTINLLGFDADAAQVLTKSLAERFGIRLAAREHIGGWGVLECDRSREAIAFADEARALFAPKAFIGDPFARVVTLLKKRGEKISFAESCTGGALAFCMTAVAGASEVFDGSLTTYSNRLKTDWLGVTSETLSNFGAVSAECVVEMALGAIGRTGADHALAISGVAGPSGGTAQKPVGTVFTGYSNVKGETFAEAHNFKGSRSMIRKQAVFQALRLALDRLS